MVFTQTLAAVQVSALVILSVTDDFMAVGVMIVKLTGAILTPSLPGSVSGVWRVRLTIRIATDDRCGFHFLPIPQVAQVLFHFSAPGPRPRELTYCTFEKLEFILWKKWPLGLPPQVRTFTREAPPIVLYENFCKAFGRCTLMRWASERILTLSVI